ncbi:acyl carrier protein [Streptomyces hygroscopicus]|uniref:acyl carrier protein n=1 Tax=Streptomyces hygroscopicus TaxID=1912 RepID=UPI00068F625D|nr:acyl carrier protein [Streptomyces hygroscopicus]
MILDRATVIATVKDIVVTEARAAVEPSAVPDGEPLAGPLLNVSSMGLLGILTRIEDAFGSAVPDDLFAGRSLKTVADLADLVSLTAEETPR